VLALSCFQIQAQVTSERVWNDLHRYSQKEALIDVEYSHDGKLLIAAFVDSIRVFNIAKHKVVRTIPFSCNTDVLFYREGRKVFYRHKEDPYVSFIKLDTTLLVKENKEFNHVAASIYSIQTRNYLTGELVNRYELDSVIFATYDKVPEMRNRFEYNFKVSKNGFAIDWRDQFILFDEKEKVIQFENEFETKDFCLLNNGRLVIVTEEGLSTIENQKKIKSFTRDSVEFIYALNGNKVAICYENGKVDFCKIGDELVNLQSHYISNSITNVVQDERGNVLYSYHNTGVHRGNRNVFLLDSSFTKYGELIVQGGQSIIVRDIPFSNKLLVTTDENSLSEFDLETEKDVPIYVHPLNHSGSKVEFITFSDDGKYMATLSDRFLVIWSVQFKHMIQRYEIELVDEVMFAKDGSYDIIYDNQACLKWRNWTSNYASTTYLMPPGEIEPFEKSHSNANNKWLKKQKEYEIPSYYSDFSSASSDLYNIAIMKPVSGYRKEVRYGANEGDVKKLNILDSENPNLVGFMNDSVAFVGFNFSIKLYNLSSGKAMGEFILQERDPGGVGVYGTSTVGAKDEILYGYSDDHLISVIDRKTGLQRSRFSIGKMNLGSDRFFDVSTDYFTFQNQNDQYTFQNIYGRKEKHHYYFTFSDVDTVMFINGSCVQVFNYPSSISGMTRFIPGSNLIASIRSDYYNMNNQSSEKVKVLNYLMFLDIENRSLEYEIELPEEVESPRMTVSADGKYIAIWDYNECSNKYLKKWGSNIDSDSFESIIIIDLNTKRQKQISLSKIDVNRIGKGDVQFVPGNSNKLIVCDDYSGIVKTINVNKNKVTSTVYGTPLRYKRKSQENGSVQSPIFPSITGDTIYFATGNPVFYNWHNQFKGYSISRDTIVLDHHDSQRITAAARISENNQAVFGHKNIGLTLFDLNSNQSIGKVIQNEKGSVFLTPDNYYRGDKEVATSIFFRVNMDLFPFSQFDLKLNRPDIILERLGEASKEEIELYYQAYKKRLSRIGFTEEMLSGDFHLPTVTIENNHNIRTYTEQDGVKMRVKAFDTKFEVDRINVWANGVPLYGMHGISARGRNMFDFDTLLHVNLTEGVNKIEVSCLNSAGAESLKVSKTIHRVKGSAKPNLHLIVLSVSDYDQDEFDLKFASKDGRDIASIFGSNSDQWNEVFVDTLFDHEVTLENIKSIKSKLLKASIHDEVILYLSGHGVLDDNFDFYYAPSNMDFTNASKNGISYDVLEDLLDGIPPRKKILLMDACHGGEVDKESIVVDTTTVADNGHKGSVKQYSYRGATVEDVAEDENKSPSAFEIMQESFVNLDRRNGATVIAASAGSSFALESDEWNNGVFTYALLNGLRNKKADLNNDGKIMLSELQEYVQNEVVEQTNGLQKPNARQENLEFDYRIW
jgi:hypothetical protein